MKYINFIFLLGSALLIGTSVDAQRRQLISGNFQAMRLDALASAIEQQTTYRFYYDPEWTDTLNTNVTAHGEPLQDVLAKVFEGTNFHFAVGSDGKVFITRDRPILSELPAGFFGEPSPQRAQTFDYSLYEKKDKELKLAESKVHTIGRNTGDTGGDATIAGNVRDALTGEPLIGASVFVQNPTIGITTDQFGYYALTLPRGRHELKIQSIGMKPTTRQILLFSGGRLDIEMDEDIKPLKEV